MADMVLGIFGSSDDVEGAIEQLKENGIDTKDMSIITDESRSLISLGVPKEDVNAYKERIKIGAILLAVPVSHDKSTELRVILDQNGAAQIRTVHAKAQVHQRVAL